MFVVNNLENFQSNFSVHGMNTRKKTHLHRPAANLPCLQKGVSYSYIKNFNSLLTSILELKNDKLLQKYLITHSAYSIENFLHTVISHS